MTRRVALALALAAAACSGEQGPTAGELSVRLAAARPGDRAVVFVVTGRLHAVTVAAGTPYRVFADTSADGDSAHVVVVAPAGSGLAAGELARIRVDDTRQVRRYTARVLELAAPTYLLSDTSGVVLTIVRP